MDGWNEAEVEFKLNTCGLVAATEWCRYHHNVSTSPSNSVPFLASIFCDTRKSMWYYKGMEHFQRTFSLSRHCSFSCRACRPLPLLCIIKKNREKRTTVSFHSNTKLMGAHTKATTCTSRKRSQFLQQGRTIGFR